MQPRRRPAPRGGTARRCLAIEPARSRQDLERHVAAERLLLGLVDDPHAAPADLAEDQVIADLAGRRGSAAHRRRPSRWHRRSRRQAPGRAAPSRPGPGKGRGSPRPARGSWSAYSSMLGRSPLRKRARNESASRSIGSRSEDEGDETGRRHGQSSSQAAAGLASQDHPESDQGPGVALAAADLSGPGPRRPRRC